MDNYETSLNEERFRELETQLNDMRRENEVLIKNLREEINLFGRESSSKRSFKSSVSPFDDNYEMTPKQTLKEGEGE